MKCVICKPRETHAGTVTVTLQRGKRPSWWKACPRWRRVLPGRRGRPQGLRTGGRGGPAPRRGRDRALCGM